MNAWNLLFPRPVQLCEIKQLNFIVNVLSDPSLGNNYLDKSNPLVYAIPCNAICAFI